MEMEKSNKTIRARLICLVLMFLLCFLFVALADTASATTYYVAKNNPGGCSDNWPGTETQPWCTIQHAADTVQAGDTVYIKEGIYYETVIPKNSGTPGNYITYQAYPGHEVVIDAENTRSWCILLPETKSLHYLKFVNLHLKNGRSDGGEFLAKGTSTEAKSHIIVDGITADGGDIARFGIYFYRVTDSEIKNCYVHHNDNGIYVNCGNSNILIHNNHVSHINDGSNKGSGINICALPGATKNENITITNNECHDVGKSRITVQNGDKILIKNNHCYRCGTRGIGSEILVTNIVIEDNLCEDNSQNYKHEPGIWVDETEYALVQRNTVYGNQKGIAISQSFHTITRFNLIYENNAGLAPDNSGGINVWGKSGSKYTPDGGEDSCP